MSNMYVEAIVQNQAEAMEAERLGVDRLELVSAISEGGLTPSYGTIKQVLNSVSIPVQIMIRPHSYHFEYTKSELEIIYADIENVLQLGGTGIVFGALNRDKTINVNVLQEIISISKGLDITFHRAFDEVASQKDAYHTLLEFKQNVRRILTSGGEPTCEAGKGNLQQLVDLAKKTGGPEIMPGSGLSTDNIEMIHRTVAANQYHFGKALREGRTFHNGFDVKTIRKLKNLD